MIDKNGWIKATDLDNSQRLEMKNANLGTDYTTGHLIDLETGHNSFLLGCEIHALADLFMEASRALLEVDAQKNIDQDPVQALQTILDESRSSLPADTLFTGDPCGVWRRKLDRIAAIAAKALDEKPDDLPNGCKDCGSSGLDFGDPCDACGGSGLEDAEDADPAKPTDDGLIHCPECDATRIAIMGLGEGISNNGTCLSCDHRFTWPFAV